MCLFGGGKGGILGEGNLNFKRALHTTYIYTIYTLNKSVWMIVSLCAGGWSDSVPGSTVSRGGANGNGNRVHS